MEEADLKCSAVDGYGSHGLPWVFGLLVIIIYWIKVIIRHVNLYCKAWFLDYNSDPNLKYRLQESHDGHSEVFGELKRRSVELQSDINLLKSRLETLQFPPAGPSTAPVTGGLPPPPPPPPPPFSLVTPAVKAAPPSSAKTDKSKKQPKGPPQFSISQDDIAKMLQKLKKTSSTSRLLGSGNNAPRKTPPRRKLFGKTPGASRNRRSITSLSPGVDVTKHKTPLSSILPAAFVDTDVNENGCDLQK